MAGSSPGRAAALLAMLLLASAAVDARPPSAGAVAAASPGADFDTRIRPPAGTGRSGPAAAGPTVSDLFGGDPLERIDRLVRGGALGLAANLLLELREGVPGDKGWQDFERRLWDVMGLRGEWSALAGRIESLAGDLPPEFALEARTRAAAARMEAGQHGAARDLLRGLLLDAGLDDPALAARWRRMIIRSYFLEGRLDDVIAAMARFQQDYYPDDDGWNLFRARVLLLSGQGPEAVSQVAAIRTDEAVLLKTLGRLRAGALTPNQAIDAVSTLIGRGMGEVADAWGVMAEAALSGGNLPIAVRALERLLALRDSPPPHALTPYTVDDLLAAGERLARQIGNAGHLLVGDDDNWLAKADALRGDTPQAARALYLFVARHGSIPAAIDRAQNAYVDSLRKHDLVPLVFRLYGPGRPLGGYATLNAALALRLSEQAIEDGDIRRAAALSSPIVTPPDGIDPFHWTLRRARLDIYAGDHEGGGRAIGALIGRQDSLSEDQVDRILQPIFDLQSVDRHDLALPLLEALYDRTGAARQRREILYWMAESMEGSELDALAAELYLRSATAAENGYDLWGQTARYQAAGAMARARLIEDARSIYEDLLRVTREPQRRAQIERKLQQLWLFQDAAAAAGG